MAVFGSFFKRCVALLLIATPLVSAVPESYLLPSDHPLKHQLDTFFSQQRVLLSMKHLERAGFKHTKPRKFTKLILATHPEMPGYLFKLYLDAQRDHHRCAVEKLWIARLQGAQKIRYLIEEHSLGHLLKVPHKWIYRLPKKPYCPKGYMPKGYLIVEEDMELLSTKANEKHWRSTQVSHELLNALFFILKEVGLSDCVKPDNIPFSKDGRVAFIDTQTHGQKVRFKSFAPWLSKANQRYWSTLTGYNR